jgi:hypothetical protein
MPTETVDSFDSLDSIALTEEVAPQAQTETTPDAQAAPIELGALEMTAPQTGPQSESQNSALENIKTYAEQSRPAAVEASVPFSLMIHGKLTSDEKEKIRDILRREAMGIDENDIEPQFEGDRILIPRISEYAGILFIQALRGTRTQMRLGPSDSIFSTEATRGAEATLQEGPTATWSSLDAEEAHPAEKIPVVTNSTLPELPRWTTIDTLTASTLLKSSTVEAERSSEYQETLEALKRELRFRAYRKGASAILNFSVQMLSLSSRSQYRMTVMGIAVREAGPQPGPGKSL